MTFKPYNGGDGARLTVTNASASVQIPGLGTGTGPDRVVVSNSGGVSAYIRFGASDVAATLASLEILPGTEKTLSPSYCLPGGVWLAAITVSGSTTVNVCAGDDV
jgi:hypothetical protein